MWPPTVNNTSEFDSMVLMTSLKFTLYCPWQNGTFNTSANYFCVRNYFTVSTRKPKYFVRLFFKQQNIVLKLFFSCFFSSEGTLRSRSISISTHLRLNLLFTWDTVFIWSRYTLCSTCFR
jgi:cellulose synthase/poly-beta-1,6-N-acetylglucosamine synthase-like glycosyltransferase